MDNQTKVLSLFTRYGEVIPALGAIAIIGILLIPMPPILLDTLLSLNLAASFSIFLLTIYVKRPLDFSVFPTLLLLITLLRLSLNVASTKLILLHAYAGKVIQAFGYFGVGGNYVVGTIVFFILVIINFIVITRGATRVSEVAARFTLDAMPGRQMSIDADLNAGLITDVQAQERRRDIERQADFYGAMDGASKFVRGDAIAAIIILLVNIIGGIIVGILQHHMDIGKALQTYLLLTVGDGMASQIPALIVSTAAGIIVTRASSESRLSMDFVKQMLSQPRILAIVSLLLFLFALIPGSPKFSLFILMILTASLFYFLNRQSKISAKKEKLVEKEEKGIQKEEKVEDLLHIDVLEIEIGYGLISLVDESQGGDLLKQITRIRRQMALEMGIILPFIRVRDNIQLKPNEYRIKIKGMDVARGELMIKYCLAMDTGTVTKPIEGIKTKEPTFGFPAIWIREDQKEEAETSGYMVVNASSVLITHLTEVIKSHAHEILGRQEVQDLINTLKEDHPAVIEELIPNLMTLGDVHKVLKNLLKERVSIRDLLTILETLADWAPQTKNIDILTEYVRQSLSRSISKQYQNEEGKIFAITLDPKLEQKFLESVEHKERTSFITINPQIIQQIITKLTPLIKKVSSLNYQPLVITSAGVRPYFKRAIERFFPSLIILSYNEIIPEVQIRPVGVISVE